MVSRSQKVAGTCEKVSCAGVDPGFYVRGGALKKKLRRAEGGANIFGVVRVKNHDFTPTKSYFYQFFGGARTGCAPP